MNYDDFETIPIIKEKNNMNNTLDVVDEKEIFNHLIYVISEDYSNSDNVLRLEPKIDAPNKGSNISLFVISHIMTCFKTQTLYDITDLFLSEKQWDSIDKDLIINSNNITIVNDFDCDDESNLKSFGIHIHKIKSVIEDRCYAFNINKLEDKSNGIVYKFI